MEFHTDFVIFPTELHNYTQYFETGCALLHHIMF